MIEMNNRPGSLPEQPVELILLHRRHVVKFTLEGFVHHLVLGVQDVVLLLEGIHVFLGLHQSVGRQRLKGRG